VTRLLKIIDDVFENRWFKYSVFILFSVLIIWLKWDHVFERDESQILLIVNYNPNFFNLISSLGYEGSTGLWHISLWLLSKIIPINPQTVSIIHGFLVLSFIWYLFFKIRIPFIFKILFLLQLPVLFNFLYVRQYILILFIMQFLIQAILNKKDLKVSLLLLILMQVHLIAIPIAMSFGIYYFFTEIVENHKKKTAFIIISLLGLLLAIIQLWPPSDLVVGLKTWKTDISIYGLSITIHKLLSDMFNVRTTLANVLFVPVMLACLIRKNINSDKKRLIILGVSFVITFSAYLSIGVTKYIGINHNCFLFFTLLALSVLLYNFSKIQFNNKWYLVLIPIMLHFGYQYRVQVSDYRYAPFSHADKVAKYLDENYKDNPVLFAPESHMNSVMLYRENQSPFFSLGRNDYCHYVKWNHPSVDHLSIKMLPIKMENLRADLQNVPDSIMHKKPVLVIGSDLIDYIIDDSGKGVKADIFIDDKISLKLIRSFDDRIANWITEKFLLFEVIYKEN
jgi:hypothetical protein